MSSPGANALPVSALGSVLKLASGTTLPTGVRGLAALVTYAIASVIVVAGAVLTGTDLTGAKLAGAVLSQPDLADAYPQGASPGHVTLAGAHLEGPCLPSSGQAGR